ncbi:hypothetical protein MLD38_038717 [Melastoma candidum]|uniref:Uncharacterized protein n=1 Tax=Melastoma candidum TaxID=119954 RepID=A0ACB9L110_9MYRT|nr:hypothetical protein MLD38_038717 [Melastoma candidum]
MQGLRRRLSQEEIEERRLKGLCFGCNEPFNRNHKCSKRQLFSLVVEELEEEVESEEELTNGLAAVEDEGMKVTLHALNGDVGEGAQTMKLCGLFGRRVLHVLVDSGSTHNFVDDSVVKGLHFTAEVIPPVQVLVADGRKLCSNRMLKQFEWEMQGHTFSADFYVLSLQGCEMILGVKWLTQLGDIIWNFQSSRMAFAWAGKEVVLQGNLGDLVGRNCKLARGKNLLKSTVYQLSVLLWNPDPISLRQLTAEDSSDSAVQSVLEEFADKVRITELPVHKDRILGAVDGYTKVLKGTGVIGKCADINESQDHEDGKELHGGDGRRGFEKSLEFVCWDLSFDLDDAQNEYNVQVGSPSIVLKSDIVARFSLSDPAFFLLAFIACTTSVAFASLVVAAVPMLYAMGRAATSLAKLADTAREELPSQMAATIWLGNYQEIAEGVNKSAQAVQAAEAENRKIGSYAREQTMSIIQERASLPVISLQPAVMGATKKTSMAVGQATKSFINMISQGEFRPEIDDEVDEDF